MARLEGAKGAKAAFQILVSFKYKSFVFIAALSNEKCKSHRFYSEKYMLIVRKAENVVCLLPKTWNLIGKPSYQLLTFLKISLLKLQKLLKTYWRSKTESWLGWVICWNNFVRIATHSESHLWNMANPRLKVNCGVSSTRAMLLR